MSETQRNNRVPTTAEVSAALIPDALLTIEVVGVLTGLAPATIRRMVSDGSFPKPVHINQRVVRWVAKVVTGWLQAKAANDPGYQAASLSGATLPLFRASR